MRKQVILVTDGDRVAQKTIERAAANIGCRCISLSAGNPTLLSGEQIISLIKMAQNDPVLVMVDDRGLCGCGKGEHVLAQIVRHPDIEVLGVLAVASNAEHTAGIQVDCSITKDGRVIDGPVDKLGNPEDPGHQYLEGDTVDILNQLDVPVIIGIGDIGKMDGADDYRQGAAITTKAIREILKRSAGHGGFRGDH